MLCNFITFSTRIRSTPSVFLFFFVCLTFCFVPYVCYVCIFCMPQHYDKVCIHFFIEIAHEFFESCDYVNCTTIFTRSKNTNPNVRASTAIVFVLQDPLGRTSKQLVTRWMNPESGYSHFATWRAKRQQDLISACGLAYRQYRNKPKRVEIIDKLSKADLPLDPEEVKRELDRRCMPHNSRHPTKLALLLLNKLIHNINGTSEPPPRTARIIAPPSPELLAEKG